MNLFIELLKQPWFAISPSPWSFAFYAVFSLIGARLLLKNAPWLYSRRPEIAVSFRVKLWRWLQASLDALFILGMIVFVQDTIWLVCNTFRWVIPYYSGVATFGNYYARFPENMLGLALFGLLTYGKWRLGVAKVNWKTLASFLSIACYTTLVFMLAPSQALTDWVFAVHTGASDGVILAAFLISHVGYKSLIALAFLSVLPWKIHPHNLKAD